MSVPFKGRDRFGLTWQPSIAAAVLANIDRIDVVEVIPEGHFLESRRARRALRRLARTLPVSIHGVSLGLGTVSRIEPRRLQRLARLVGEVEPESWSEHLAFVRASGVELGHLAAPPRTAASIDAIADHAELARRYVGSYPSLENVATPLEPPGSDRSEGEWIVDVLEASPAGLLLDLHNAYTNAMNFGFDPVAFIDALPIDRVRAIHIAGGIDISSGGGVRRIDDHLHDVPEAVYDLLAHVGQRVPHPVDVILERDGAFPSFSHLLAQVDRAREALARGRARAGGASDRRSRGSEDTPTSAAANMTHSDVVAVEGFLARLFTDRNLRARFVVAPVEEAVRSGLSRMQALAFDQIDCAGLELAAASFARKRAGARQLDWSLVEVVKRFLPMSWPHPRTTR